MWRTNAQIHPWLQLDMRESVRVVKVTDLTDLTDHYGNVMVMVMVVMVLVVKVRDLTSQPR